MPDDNVTKEAVATVVGGAVDERDALIKDLRQKAEEFEARAVKLEKDSETLVKNAERKVKDLEARLKAVKPAPTGDFVQLDGKVYPVVTTVRADNTFAEVKRGNVYEHACMVVIDKVH